MSIYGYCPKCGAPSVSRERRPDGNDECENGHTYPSKDAVVKIQREDWIWYIVVDERGNILEGFNSEFGAEHWRELNGGIIIPVKEKSNS